MAIIICLNQPEGKDIKSLLTKENLRKIAQLEEEILSGNSETEDRPDSISETLRPDAEVTITIQRFGEAYRIIDKHKLLDLFK